MTGYYNLLGVPHGASAEALRRAYRERAKAVHPDAHPGASPAEKERLRQEFIRLTQAFEVLSDPVKRAAYERLTQGMAGKDMAGKDMARKGRTRQSSPGGADSRTRPVGGHADAPPPPPGPDLDDLLNNVDDLLGRFGLNRRQPLEDLLEALWQWALAVFREVMLGESSPHAHDDPGAQPRAQARAKTHQERVHAAEAVEAELRRLKERLKPSR